LANVEHVRVVKSKLLHLLDRATFRLTALFGIGPWHCLSCGKRKLLFPPLRRNAVHYDPNPIESPIEAEADAERLGNIFYSTVSLVHRSDRAKYYSEKFRDGIAERILSGSGTLSQVQKSLGISELDLQDWLCRYHQKRVMASAIRGHLIDRSSLDDAANESIVDEFPDLSSPQPARFN
jgi:hypothetical protein